MRAYQRDAVFLYDKNLWAMVLWRDLFPIQTDILKFSLACCNYDIHESKIQIYDEFF